MTGACSAVTEIVCLQCGKPSRRYPSAKFCFECANDRQRTKRGMLQEQWIGFIKGRDERWHVAGDCQLVAEAEAKEWAAKDTESRIVRQVLLPR